MSDYLMWHSQKQMKNNRKAAVADGGFGKPHRPLKKA